MDAYFDGPVRALQCAAALASALPVSCGVHTGEVIRQGSRVAGEAFSIAEELAAGTPQGEVAASRVVADLVPGSAFSFDAAERTVQSDGRTIGVFSMRLES